MPNKPTDTEIKKARGVSLKEQIEHCNERLKETLDSYYRRNTNGVEDPLEICVLRESAVLISKLESIINRLQAENERFGELKTILDMFWEALLKIGMAKRKEKPTLKAEAYKEFAERLDKEFSGVGTCNYGCVHHKTRKVLKELVGEDK